MLWPISERSARLPFLTQDGGQASDKLTKGGTVNILLVEDDEIQRLLMRNFFVEEGWTVFLAEHGKEALEKIKRDRMDLIVSDIYMPVMDGIKLHRAVRKMTEYETTPFLFVSAYDDEYTMQAIENPTISTASSRKEGTSSR
jgi:CheY-like chemotaxis protein